MAAEKIKQLRSWMKKNDVQAYIVPHSDRFQSEYLAPEDERLAWLTGFTGSAGYALVSEKKASLLVDGRYTLQAPQQIDTSSMTVEEVGVKNPTPIWISKYVKKGDKLGFDPWLLTVTQIAQYQKVAEENGWKLVSIAENPIDVLWKDRPEEIIRPAEIHDVKYAGEDRAKKIQKVMEKKNAKADAILVTEPSLVCWLLNVRGRDINYNPLLQSIALIEKNNRVTLFADKRKISTSMRQGLGKNVAIDDIGNVPNVLASYKKPIQIDPNQTPFAIKEICDKNKVTLISEKDPGVLARAQKNNTEVKGAKLAHVKDRKAFDVFLKWYGAQDFSKTKITELDVMAKLHDARAKDRDFVEESFNTIAGFGPNGAIVHYHATKDSVLRLKPNNLLLLDSGGQYRCGTTDITRTLAVGNPTVEMKKHYTAVLKGLIALSTTRFPAETTGAQLDALARAPIWQLGLNYTHGTGHGIGSFLCVHEGPQGISHASNVPLKPGMILSVEPGIYLQDKYGIRLENLVVVKEDKKPGDAFAMLALETLTKVPFDDKLIGWEELSPAETKFLENFDNYPKTKSKAPKKRL